MALVLERNVGESTITTGTGNIALGGALSGLHPFSQVASNGDEFPYYIVDADGVGFECGLGKYLARDNVMSRYFINGSSNPVTAPDPDTGDPMPTGEYLPVDLSTGTHQVYLAAEGVHLPGSVLTVDGIVAAIRGFAVESNTSFDQAIQRIYACVTGPTLGVSDRSPVEQFLSPDGSVARVTQYFDEDGNRESVEFDQPVPA